MPITGPSLGLSRFIASSVSQGQQGEHQRRGVGAGHVEALEALLDEQRQRLGLARELAGDDAHRAELAERARRREHHAVGDAPADRGQRDRGRRSASELAPSVAAACSCSVPISRSTGTTSRTTNGSETKIVARTMPGSREDDPDAVVGQPAAEPAVARP